MTPRNGSNGGVKLKPINRKSEPSRPAEVTGFESSAYWAHKMGAQKSRCHNKIAITALIKVGVTGIESAFLLGTRS